ncbi:hypothetical protein [Paenibacillus durus]|uniref:Lipoprotein n=1 Tax=Paenibacillus durus ATCC 35681 TaxID=1333534 RepID=A0A0F7FFC7_PAEDU|nr:hypothetical protein [Paenibacillus durus]AKG37344.1 hypothetical protein VK70_25035 [Paenibacillus durus ATCC 35681]
MNKHLKISIFILLMAMLLLSCSSNGKSYSADYISLTYSDYATTNTNGKIKTQILSYDSSTKKVEKIFEFDYTAQYPLGYYDKPNQLVYYTKRVGDEKKYGDQIFVRDLSNNKDIQLTDNLFAINYIIPVATNKLFFVASLKGEEVLKLGSINIDTKEMSFWGDNDTIIEAATIDKKNKKIYVSTYSMKERNYSLTHQNGPVGQNNFKMPKYTVFETDYNFKNNLKLFSKNYWIRSIMTNDNYVIALCDKQYNDAEVPSTVISYDLADHSIDTKLWKGARLQVGDANFSFDGTKIYTISVVNKKRGLYEYNMNTQKYTPLFIPDKGFINNIQVVKEL